VRPWRCRGSAPPTWYWPICSGFVGDGDDLADRLAVGGACGVKVSGISPSCEISDRLECFARAFGEHGLGMSRPGC
jgi:hypothetical protein